ncbi:MAG: NADH-quinone oxidoreductase subunit NuoF [Candidatus Omnitrophica bacterium]|nr:NADH-quinone oxidoreductase subunit NuoF [Candidatus Omnitrophota bacterium]
MAQVNDRYVGPLDRAAVDRLLEDPTLAPLTPSLSPQGRGREGEGILSRRFSQAGGAWYDAYVADGGYEAAKQALTTMTPQQVIDEVMRANLRGLGGAGFPTGKKWSFIPKSSPKPVYLVVNADEGEPGTFKDRYLLERDPHAVLEGMLIAAYAIGSHKAYIYIRGEYVEAYQRFCRAVEEARARGWVGRGVQGRWEWDVTVHRGAGAYICGEETALLTSLEGGKGFPRLKPPFPAISGLFASPTIVNNVETLASVPPIIRRGAAWFAGLGTPKQGGMRLFSLCGHVERPGIYEASAGVTLRSLIERAGGVRAGRPLKAVVPGGISAKILTAQEIDVAMDFDSLAAAGTMAGSGGVIVMDDTTCMVKALATAAKFFAHESCGQCSPCREGTGWAYKILSRILRGDGRPGDLDTLLSVAGNMEGKTICVFADAAAWPIQSYIRKFREEFEHHVREGHCDLLSSPVSLSPACPH